MVLGNVFGGILGGLAGGTAVTNVQTNYYSITPISGTTCTTCNEAQWQGAIGQGFNRSLLEWQVYQNGTYELTNNIQWQAAQWFGQLQGTATMNWYTYNTLGSATIQAPEIWVQHFTPEELKAMEVAEEKRRIERAAAKTAATELLRSQLDREQLVQFERDGHFDVKIKDRVYRITPGRKVHALHEKKDAHLCIAPSGYELPNEDVALAQKLLLEANEKEFLKTAIRWAA